MYVLSRSVNNRIVFGVAFLASVNCCCAKMYRYTFVQWWKRLRFQLNIHYIWLCRDQTPSLNAFVLEFIGNALDCMHQLRDVRHRWDESAIPTRLDQTDKLQWEAICISVFFGNMCIQFSMQSLADRMEYFVTTQWFNTTKMLLDIGNISFCYQYE